MSIFAAGRSLMGWICLILGSFYLYWRFDIVAEFFVSPSHVAHHVTLLLAPLVLFVCGLLLILRKGKKNE